MPTARFISDTWQAFMFLPTFMSLPCTRRHVASVQFALTVHKGTADAGMLLLRVAFADLHIKTDVLAHHARERRKFAQHNRSGAELAPLLGLN